MCSDDFFDTGFQKLYGDCKGNNFILRRPQRPSSNANKFHMPELRLYQTPNLIQELEGAVLISAPAPIDPIWAATNLITNLAIRSSGNNLYPLID